ncbi:MAG TPA: hypothetical protein DCS29_00485 [Candidatus Magasanikbacteria bacterium]|nr:MAG: hypothetical protein A2479_01130 [Candidatus Magasanikbacteria bacterium RIFOXYC2_FULL_39_8]HAT03242.1 hypothetical protein [Candidatus Magasanikbacteria bacterium]
MTIKQLSQPTLQLINQFLHLTFNGKRVRTPYFNNRRSGTRGALRVSIGKGNVNDIKEELKILSLREKIDLRELDEQTITEFIVDHKIGIDCSGLVYYILDEELKSQHKNHLKTYLKFPDAKNPLRKLLIKLRPVENCNVKTLAYEINSAEINLNNIQAGDMIIMMNAGARHDYNHVMVITHIDDTTIHYVHSFQYPEDGLYNHGVREETITIINTSKSITEQQWNCEEMKRYKDTAEKIQIRRIKALS